MKENIAKIARAAVGLAAGTVIVFFVRNLFAKERAATEQKKAPGTTTPTAAPKRTNPPNISGDPEGYNTSLFPDGAAVADVFRVLGYPDASASSVKQFQQNWNAAIEAVEGNKEAEQANLYGKLVVDGIPGKFTLRAAEIAFRLNVGPGWQTRIYSIAA